MSKFRVQYKTVGLTYSQCNLAKKHVMDKLLEKYPDIGDYYACQETHKDGKKHLHIWFEFTHKPNLKNARCFDIDGQHPNIKKCKRNWVWNYLRKEDPSPYTNIAQGYIDLARKGQYEAALESFIGQHPKEFVLHAQRVCTNLRNLGKRKRQDTVYPVETSPYYEHLDTLDWEPKEISLVLHGPTNTGKTEFAKSWCKENGWTYLTINTIDGLKKYDDEDIIIWDDMSFKHIPRESAIHITEVKNSREIHCRHRDQYIPPGVGNIFTTNKIDMWPEDPYGAIDRRLQIWAPLNNIVRGAFGAHRQPIGFNGQKRVKFAKVICHNGGSPPPANLVIPGR